MAICLRGIRRLFFEKGEIYVDEMWGVRDGSIWFSSFQEGVSAIRDGEIVHCYRSSERPLGKFLRLEMRATDGLISRLAAA